MKLHRGKTARGFSLIEFTDYYDKKCSIQKSSIATQDMIWMGIDDPTPEIMAQHTAQGGVGWVPFFIPKEVSIHTRMHLTKDQAWSIVKILVKFIITGNI